MAQAGGFFMNKKGYLIILLFFSSLSYAAKPIILWDIHEVLLQPKNRIVTLVQFPYFTQLFSHFSWPLAKDLFTLIGKEITSGTSSEEFIQAANQHAPLFKPMNISKSQVVSLVNGEAIKKPSANYFEQYLEKNNIDLRDQPVIFIDDRWENIRVAKAMGFDAILFKTPQQLRIELAKRNIPIKKPPYIFSSHRDKYFLRKPGSFIKPMKTS